MFLRNSCNKINCELGIAFIMVTNGDKLLSKQVTFTIDCYMYETLSTQVATRTIDDTSPMSHT